MKILLVEDNRALSEWLARTLKADKYVLRVVGTQNGPTAQTTLSLLVSLDGESRA